MHKFLPALMTACLSLNSACLLADDEAPATYQFKSLSVESAQKAAMSAMLDCRKQGYSVAVAVVDRGGNLQAFVRDQLAGPHTTETAIRKAWTANSFRVPTLQLAILHKDGVLPDQVQHNPGALLVGGGELVRLQGAIIGGIGVSGAPPGKTEKESIDGNCALAGLKAIEEALAFSD